MVSCCECAHGGRTSVEISPCIVFFALHLIPTCGSVAVICIGSVFLSLFFSPWIRPTSGLSKVFSRYGELGRAMNDCCESRNAGVLEFSLRDSGVD